MPTFNCTAMTFAHFFFNHVISHFGVPKQLISDHGKHFEKEIFEEISSLLCFRHKLATTYYPQANGKVEAVKKLLKTILHWSIDKNHSNWHNQLYSTLWVYRTTIKTVTDSTPFHLVHGIEVILPIECEIPILRSVDENQRASLQHNEAMKWCYKAIYDQRVQPHRFHEGDLVLALLAALGKPRFELRRLPTKPLDTGPFANDLQAGRSLTRSY